MLDWSEEPAKVAKGRNERRKLQAEVKYVGKEAAVKGSVEKTGVL